MATTATNGSSNRPAYTGPLSKDEASRETYIESLSKGAASFEMANFLSRYKVKVKFPEQSSPSRLTMDDTSLSKSFIAGLKELLQNSFRGLLRIVSNKDLSRAAGMKDLLWPKKTVSVDAHLQELETPMALAIGPECTKYFEEVTLPEDLAEGVKRDFLKPVRDKMQVLKRVIPIVVKTQDEIDEDVNSVLNNYLGASTIRVNRRNRPVPLFDSIRSVEVQQPQINEEEKEKWQIVSPFKPRQWDLSLSQSPYLNYPTVDSSHELTIESDEMDIFPESEASPSQQRQRRTSGGSSIADEDINALSEEDLEEDGVETEPEMKEVNSDEFNRIREMESDLFS